MGPIRVVVETNDFTLLPGLPFDEAGTEMPEWTFEWKLVRDAEAVGTLEEPLSLTLSLIHI